MNLISYLTTIGFGAGALAELPSLLAELGITRPFLVSDRGIKAAGLIERLEGLIPKESASFFDTPTNPTEAAVLQALAAYQAAGADGLIAFGGGSSIDLAKGVALLATHEGPLESYAAILGGIPKISAKVAPLIAIPTTAGTGSEVGRAALITLNDGRKLGFISPHLIPRRALCDPELTLDLPDWLTSATALDALSHCIETYLSPRFNPPAEAIALDGFARIWAALPRALENGKDIEARSDLMMGALQGGLCFQKGLGAVHALSHALGGLAELKLHHGTLNAILMPEVLRWNESAAGVKLDRLAGAIGLASGRDLAAALDGLNSRCAIPQRLGEMGFTEDLIPLIARRALADHSHATNPRQLTVEDYAAILRSVL